MAANFDLAEAWFRNDCIVSPQKNCNQWLWLHVTPIIVIEDIGSSVSGWIGWTCSLSSCVWCCLQHAHLLMHWMCDSASLLKTSPSTSGCMLGHVVLPATPFSSTLHWATYRMPQSGNQQKLLVLKKDLNQHFCTQSKDTSTPRHSLWHYKSLALTVVTPMKHHCLLARSGIFWLRTSWLEELYYQSLKTLSLQCDVVTGNNMISACVWTAPR